MECGGWVSEGVRGVGACFGGHDWILRCVQIASLGVVGSADLRQNTSRNYAGATFAPQVNRSEATRAWFCTCFMRNTCLLKDIPPPDREFPLCRPASPVSTFPSLNGSSLTGCSVKHQVPLLGCLLPFAHLTLAAGTTDAGTLAILLSLTNTRRIAEARSLNCLQNK